jgi:amylovoran biosynthesis protein AmsC
MAIYWIISYTILVFCVFELAAINQLREVKTRSMVNYLFFIFTVLLICFAGMRGPGSGIDDWQYLGFFHDLANQVHISDFSTVAQIYRYENFFTLLAGLLSLFTKESYYFLLFVAIVAVSTNAWCYKNIRR